MKLMIFLQRKRKSLIDFFSECNIDSYEDLQSFCEKFNLVCPNREDINHEFKTDVEERSVAKSSVKKKRVSNKKSSKPKTNDSSSSRRSRSAQRSRKSSNKPQRKSNGGKVESVQPISGSEDTK